MAVVRHKCCSVSALSPAGMTNQSLSLFHSLQWRPAEFPGGKVYTFLKKKKKDRRGEGKYSLFSSQETHYTQRAYVTCFPWKIGVFKVSDFLLQLFIQ